MAGRGRENLFSANTGRALISLPVADWANIGENINVVNVGSALGQEVVQSPDGLQLPHKPERHAIHAVA